MKRRSAHVVIVVAGLSELDSAKKTEVAVVGCTISEEENVVASVGLDTTEKVVAWACSEEEIDVVGDCTLV